MVGWMARIRNNRIKKIHSFTKLIEEVITLTEEECRRKQEGEISKWDYKLLQNVVDLEMKELLLHAKNEKVYFKYGKQQRILESTYVITDSTEQLKETTLGRKILELQQMYNSF